MVNLNQNKRITMENQRINQEIIWDRQFSFKKSKTEEDTIHYILQLIIHNADGIDPPTVPSPNKSVAGIIHPRYYQVLSSINSRYEYQTRKKREEELDAKSAWCKRLVRWNHLFEIPLINIVDLESVNLSLEVTRVLADADPGTSKGVVVVGRVQARLPKEPEIRVNKRIGLARFVDGKIVPQGHITVSMTLLPPNKFTNRW